MDHHQPRRPRTEDAAAIHELISARDIAAVGHPDMTLNDVSDELAEPGFDLDRDGWLWQDEDGRLVAWAWASRKGNSDMVDIEVIERPGTQGERTETLWSTVLERARELAEEAGHQGATVDIGVHRTDEPQRALAKAHGFEPSTSFHRLRVDHDGPVEAPQPPQGLTLHKGVTDEVRREAHAIHQKGFAGHFGFVPLTYDEWYARKQTQSTTDWSQVTVARIDGEPAAMLVGANHFVPDENCGYVATLATLPEYRGRGLGRFLLRTAFAADAARGRKGTILHVDANNTTPALDLYQSVGMRPVLVIDVWRRRV